MTLLKTTYDKKEDILHLLFKEGPSYEVIEADPDVLLELDKKTKSWASKFGTPNKAVL